jgi:hypothetical protein
LCDFAVVERDTLFFALPERLPALRGLATDFLAGRRFGDCFETALALLTTFRTAPVAATQILKDAETILA